MLKINILIFATNEAEKDNTLEVTIQDVKILEEQTYLDYCQQNLKHLNYRLIFFQFWPRQLNILTSEFLDLDLKRIYHQIKIRNVHKI